MTAPALLQAVTTGSATSWRDEAICAQTDPEAFFPEVGRSPRAALQVCMACPVRTDGLTDALARNERHGIWGGTTETQRRHLRSQQRDTTRQSA